MLEITPKIKDDFKKINNLVFSSKNILITSHQAPDEDAVGSSIALKLALEKQGINSSIYISGYPQKDFSFLPGYNLIKSKLDHHNFDLVFGLDYGDFKRLAIDDLIKESNPNIITIDHHIDKGSSHIGKIKIIKSASSTAEIIYHYLNHFKINIDQNIATCLLSGIIGDTGGFLHSNTSYKTLSIAGELLAKGVGINKITKQILNNKNLINNSKNLGKTLSNVKKCSEVDLVYLIINNQDFSSWYKSYSDNLVSIINTAKDCKWALLLVEYDNGKTKASLRSEEYAGIDVSKFANLFGGGGHKLASGFKIDKKPEKVLELLIKEVKKQKTMAL